MQINTTTPQAGMLVTAIQIDDDGFYGAESNVQIIVKVDKNQITTISMNDPEGINKPITYTDGATTIDNKKYEIVFDQNNSFDLMFKAINTKPELLRFEDIESYLVQNYTRLATSKQLTPTELKLFESIHEMLKKRFSIKFQAPKLIHTASATTTKEVPVSKKKTISEIDA